MYGDNRPTSWNAVHEPPTWNRNQSVFIFCSSLCRYRSWLSSGPSLRCVWVFVLSIVISDNTRCVLTGPYLSFTVVSIQVRPLHLKPCFYLQRFLFSSEFHAGSQVSGQEVERGERGKKRGWASAWTCWIAYANGCAFQIQMGWWTLAFNPRGQVHHTQEHLHLLTSSYHTNALIHTTPLDHTCTDKRTHTHTRTLTHSITHSLTLTHTHAK